MKYLYPPHEWKCFMREEPRCYYPLVLSQSRITHPFIQQARF